MSQTKTRPARPDDCAEIAKLCLISSDGIAEYIWSLVDIPGLSLIEIGTQRYAREGTSFSYQNCLVAEQDGKVVGMLHGFAMVPDPGPPPEEDPDPVLRPYAELKDYGSFHISSIALYPNFRNQGHGTRLLEAAQEQARSLGLPRVSLTCFERNEAAMRLYRRFGFQETDRRAIVPHPTLHYSDGDALLLVRATD